MFVLETANFQVCCEQSETAARQLARRAETLRAALQSKWLGNKTSEAWKPRCQIILHSNKQSYVATVGRGSERTVGSSLVNIDKGRIAQRRIDLLGGSKEYLSAALPHELTHVVLKDRFISMKLPRWADEGIAILADPKAKQGRHFADLKNALAQSATFHAASLLMMDEYPRADRFSTFYGQSASLTEFLVSRRTPQEFIEFLEQADREGFDKALRGCYEISGVSELDRQWRRHLHTVEPVSFKGS